MQTPSWRVKLSNRNGLVWTRQVLSHHVDSQCRVVWVCLATVSRGFLLLAIDGRRCGGTRGQPCVSSLVGAPVRYLQHCCSCPPPPCPAPALVLVLVLVLVLLLVLVPTNGSTSALTSLHNRENLEDEQKSETFISTTIKG